MAPSSTFSWSRTLPLAAGLAVLVAAGLVHGLWSNRWGDNRDLEAAAGRLRAIPLDVAGWKGHEKKIDADRIGRAEAVAYLHRTHVGPGGRAVSVVLLCGRFGPLSVHTPDVCYGGAGYQMLGQPTRHRLRLDDGTTVEFWTARFQKPDDYAAPPLRILWTWSAGKDWLAPSMPRWTFRMEPVLFKLYVAREMATAEEPLETDPCLEFLRAWLPRADDALFGDAEKATAR